MPEQHTYRVAGLTIRVPDTLPFAAGPPGPADLTVAWHDCARPCAVDGEPDPDQPWVIARESDDHTRYTFAGLGDVVVNHRAGAVTLHPAPEATASTMWHLFLDQVLPLYLAARGDLVLHASSVAVPTKSGVRAVIFVGESGAGKSTIAAGCALTGAKLLGDDFARISFGSPTPAVFAANLGVRLWADSAAATAPGEGEPVAHFTAKVRISSPLIGGAESAADPVPIGALVVVGDLGPSSSAPALEALSPAWAFAEVLRHSFRLDVPAPDSRLAAMDRATRLVDSVPAFWLEMPDGLEGVTSTSARLLDTLAERLEEWAASDVRGR